MILAALAGLLCLGTGLALVCLLWPATITSDLPLKLSFAPAYGIGVFSGVFFVRLVLGLPQAILFGADIALAGLLLLGLRRKLHSQSQPDVRPSQNTGNNVLGWIASVPLGSFAILLSAWLYGAGRLVGANPEGLGSDAYAIWNLRARFLFLGGAHWRDGFSTPIIWSHTNYPLLISASIAHGWKYVGADSTVVPAGIAFIFTFSTVGLLVTALKRLRGTTQACLGGCVLLGSVTFLVNGLSQCADVPVGFFFLSSFVLLFLSEATGENARRFMALAGLAAGFAAWTKNEGILFFVAMLAVQAAMALRRSSGESFRRLAWFLLGALPVLAVLAYFKICVAGPNDLYSTPAAILPRLADMTRYWLILSHVTRELLFSGNWLVIPAPIVAVVYAFLLGKKPRSPQDAAVSGSALTFAVMLAGYFMVYLITPYDLEWHLKYSLSRLFVQLWPSAIFLFFMAVRSPDELQNLQA